MQRSTPSKAEEKLALEERKARQMIKDKESARVARNAKVEKLKALRIAKEAEELKAKEGGGKEEDRRLKIAPPETARPAVTRL